MHIDCLRLHGCNGIPVTCLHESSFFRNVSRSLFLYIGLGGLMDRFSPHKVGAGGGAGLFSAVCGDGRAVQGDPAGGRGRRPRPTSIFLAQARVLTLRSQLRPRHDHHLWRLRFFGRWR